MPPHHDSNPTVTRQRAVRLRIERDQPLASEQPLVTTIERYKSRTCEDERDHASIVSVSANQRIGVGIRGDDPDVITSRERTHDGTALGCLAFGGCAVWVHAVQRASASRRVKPPLQASGTA